MAITTGEGLREAMGAEAIAPGVILQGQLIRKRAVSKGLLFGDIELADKELVQMMAHSGEAPWTKATIVQLNWDLHIGDIIQVTGEARREASNGDRILVAIQSYSVVASWDVLHPGAPFEYGASSHIVPAPLATKQSYDNMIQLAGQNACKFYFSNATCDRGDGCHFYHGPIDKYAELRAEWLEKRAAQKRALAMVDGDPNDPHSKALKSHRAALFTEWLVATFGASTLGAGTGVLDVAGGKGDISFELVCKRDLPATLIDPRVVKQRKAHLKYMAAHQKAKWSHILAELNDALVVTHASLFRDCAALVGMHPDEATEPIVDMALRLNKPFAVVPCCVMSRLFPNRECNNGKVATYDEFVAYLKAKDPRIHSTFLPFAGKNQVVYMLP
ncbi:hypothetical protein SDRG_16811 [Saprolegnia diclina VS20]|uniref:C3H1-type domain-containing protein n=1 Tax=Saprolegnia diclina (strain VS20) TaxID=1156394 RepID=T0PW98_SAPDV|nr:hypothetical protein SDRG_16811 [Saprolegnia diclina VS20]EQC25315.1 hypothetical protein SDRG_16811 [Saprolegnia diclina VS20]|eukprot:XP_008621253.1 hypothetical protein SDRG_16811 [Saprolegnia diclina VS20]